MYHARYIRFNTFKQRFLKHRVFKRNGVKIQYLSRRINTRGATRKKTREECHKCEGLSR